MSSAHIGPGKDLVDYWSNRAAGQQRHNLLSHASRFDVVAVSWPANRCEPEIVHFPNAFEPVGQFQMFT